MYIAEGIQKDSWIWIYSNEAGGIADDFYCIFPMKTKQIYHQSTGLWLKGNFEQIFVTESSSTTNTVRFSL